MIQNLHFCGLYKSSYKVKRKSANLLIIPVCPNPVGLDLQKISIIKSKMNSPHLVIICDN